jgi:hypothetical protein
VDGADFKKLNLRFADQRNDSSNTELQVAQQEVEALIELRREGDHDSKSKLDRDSEARLKDDLASS